MVNVIITKRISFVKLADKKWCYTATQAKKKNLFYCVETKVATHLLAVRNWTWVKTITTYKVALVLSQYDSNFYLQIRYLRISVG